MTTYYRQLADYTKALRAYIKEATGLDASRIVFSPPDTAKRKLKEVLAETSNPQVSTTEIDNFVSFYFPFAAPGVAVERQSPMQSFFGAVAGKLRQLSWADNYDLPVQIDIWAGPDQNGKAFNFNTRMDLEWYMQRHHGIHVAFRDFTAWDPNNPSAEFDVRDYYELIKGAVTDNSAVENLFTEGALLRTTVEFTWMIALYRLPSVSTPVGRIEHIIAEFQNDVTKEFDVEWEITTSTTTVI